MLADSTSLCCAAVSLVACANDGGGNGITQPRARSCVHGFYGVLGHVVRCTNPDPGMADAAAPL